VTTTGQVTAESTMEQILGAYPGAQRALMRRYHIGGCSNCGFSPNERLGEVLSRHGVSDSDEVINHIRQSHEQEQRIQIDPAELAEALKWTEPPKLIDVRASQEQEVCKIDGALPASQELVQEMMASWRKDTAIVVYCHKGVRSIDAASYLIGHGFTNVRSLRGGISAWAEQIDPGMTRY